MTSIMPIVFLSAGHGGKDPGACAFGLKEKDINLQILLACKPELERHGVKVICSRTTDENDPVGDEVREANASGAAIAVSFHTNAARGDGSETYYFSKDKNGKRLAELCEKHTKAIGQNSRGAKANDGLWFIRGTNMTAVLCECAFIDNDKDNDIIDTVAEQQAFGKAYAKAILEYLGIEYKSAAVVVEKPSENITVTNKVDYAKSFNKAYAGTYKTTTELNLRAGANTSKALITKMPKGAEVQCYGYYTKESDGTVWLYVKYGNYVGFAGSGYLKK